MLKALQRLYRCRLGRFLKRRLAGVNAESKTLTEHADRAKFHRSREFIAAARAGALGLPFHGSDRSSEPIKASQIAWISSSVVAFHNEFCVSPTITAETMFRNKISGNSEDRVCRLRFLSPSVRRLVEKNALYRCLDKVLALVMRAGYLMNYQYEVVAKALD
jgi:hypothetical protein